MRNVLLLTMSMAMALAASGCGDDSDTGSGTPAGSCFDYDAFNAGSPAVTFRADVLPLFQRSCSTSATSCHGSEAGTSDRQYLGPQLGTMATEEQIAKIMAQNVGVPSKKEPGLSRVAKGDPANSFLMHKMDEPLCEDLTCAADKSCGSAMPLGQTLEQGDRDVVRRWIAQGAQNN